MLLARWLRAWCCFHLKLLARVGGGQSYGGGRRGGGGGGGGDGDGGAIIDLVRILLWLTIEYPALGFRSTLPWWFCGLPFARRGKKASESFSSATPNVTGIPQLMAPLGLDAAARRVTDLNREFAQLRKFDPNFSEIVFTDFCYALYGKAHDARGHGENALDQFSPYLSEARASRCCSAIPTA